MDEQRIREIVREEVIKVMECVYYPPTPDEKVAAETATLAHYGLVDFNLRVD